MRASVICAVMALCSSCAPSEPARPAAGTTVTAVPTAPVHGATPAWRYALPPGWEISHVRIADTAVVIGGRSDVRVLDPATGRVRWQRRGGAWAMVLGDNAVYYGATGTIVSRALTSGRALWDRPAVCPASTTNTSLGGVAAIVRHADDLIVGCRGGRLVRIAAASGRILADSGNAFEAESIADIVPLGSCAYGISGWSTGAAMRGHAAVLDCKRLGVIVPEQDDMLIVGSIGEIAVLDERCCFGRADVYRPATIVRANLSTGALSPEVDLRPEPDRYPSDHRPVGQASAVLLAGTELVVVVERTLYRYGDARALSASPERIADDLVDFPTILRHELLAVRRRTPSGAIEDAIVRIRNGRLDAIWSSRESRPVMFAYEADLDPDILTVRGTDESTLIRTYDGAQLFVTDPCQMYGANRYLVVMLCTTDTLVGNRYLQYLAAYRWHDAVPRGSIAPGR